MKDQMTIVHVAEAWKGGVATYVESIINAQTKDGHQVTLLVDKNNFGADPRQLDCKVIFFNGSRNPAKMFNVAKEISSLLKTLCPDLIHCHSTFAGIYCRLQKPISKTIYTPHAWSFYKKDVSFFHRKVYQWIERYLAKHTDRIICISQEEINAALKAGISQSKLSLLYTGLKEADTENSQSGHINNKLNIGFFGRFDYQKGFDLIIKSHDKLKSELQIHLFGDFVRSETSTLPDSFIHHGWIPNQQMHQQMSLMDAIIVPSRWEGFALTPLEAMRAGKAIVISNCSSLPEVVIDGYNGLILPNLSSDSIANTLNQLDHALCHELGRNGRHIFEKRFSFERFYQQLMKLYRE